MVKNGYFGKQILVILVVQVVRYNGHFGEQLTVILVVDLTAISVIIRFRRIERLSNRKLPNQKFVGNKLNEKVI